MMKKLYKHLTNYGEAIIAPQLQNLRTSILCGSPQNRPTCNKDLD